MRLWIKIWGGTAGPGLMVERGVHFRHPPGRQWRIEPGTYIGRGVIIDIWPGAKLRVGNNTKIMQYVVIGAREEVSIGSNSQISEFTTVRDADHGIDTNELISRAPMISKPVTIGSNVWVARGCAILKGVVINDGVVVAANSVVIGTFPENVVIAGSPAKIKRHRAPGS